VPTVVPAGWFSGRELALKVILVGAPFSAASLIVTLILAESVAPSSSVTVSVTVYCPGYYRYG